MVGAVRGPPAFTTWQNNTNAVWYKDASLRRNWASLFVLYMGVYALGYDGTLLTGLQGLNKWQTFYGSPKGTTLGLIAASYFFPKIFLAPAFAAWLSDKTGRKIPLYIGSVFLVAGAFLGCFATGRGMLIGSRVILGFGTTMVLVCGAPLCSELAHPRYRAKAGALFFSMFYIGSILSGWITFAMTRWPAGGDWQWRLPNLLQGLGPLILLVGLFIVPESPRWLVSKGRREEAHAILAKAHANGKMDDELVLNEMKEIDEAVAIERDARGTRWAAFFEGKGNQRRFIVITLISVCSQMNGVGIISYYLAPVLRQVGVTDQVQITAINGGLAIWNLCAAITGSFLTEKLGRRTLFLISCCGTCLFFAGMTGVSGAYASTRHAGTGLAVIPLIYLFYGFYAIAFTPLPPLYISEICNVSLRLKGVALLSTYQSISLAYNSFVNPIALAAIQWRYYFVFLVLQVLFGLAIWALVLETKGLTIEESSQVYDTPVFAPRQKLFPREAAAELGAGTDSKEERSLKEEI